MKTTEKIVELEKQITDLKALVNFYEEQFKLSQRHRFGKSSEQSPEQLYFENVFNEAEDQADEKLPELTYEQITYKRKKRVGKKEEDLSCLPVERIDYELPEAQRLCPEHGTPMREIGIKVRDEIGIVPAKVVHIEHVTHVYACSDCGKESDTTPILKSEAPKPLISGSVASPSIVAYLAVQKYMNGMPLYRMEKGFDYEGITLSRQTMANWLIYCTQNYLHGFYLLLIKYLLKESLLHGDETTLQVLHEPNRTAQNKSYEWLYRTSKYSTHQIIIYQYKETRKQEHPQKFLSEFKGYLHCDGYQCYHNLPPDIIIVGCWAHVHRYWEELYETISESKHSGSNAERGLLYINLLFWFEDDFQDMEPEERYKKRLELSKPVSDEFFEWVSSLNALPKSLLGKAVHYSLSQRGYLENVYLDGRLEISNNRAERSIKPFVQGRKQWLFSNTPNGAESSSILYSIIETAKENKLNPFNYIKYLLETIPNINSSGFEELLPWSNSLPDNCRVPQKSVEAKPIKRKYSKDKGPLAHALAKLRKYFQEKQGAIDS